jgi:hypothetical protein
MIWVLRTLLVLWLIAGSIALWRWHDWRRARRSLLGLWLLGGLGLALGFWAQGRPLFGEVHSVCFTEQPRHLDLAIARGKLWVVREGERWFRLGRSDLAHFKSRLASCPKGGLLYRASRGQQVRLAMAGDAVRLAAAPNAGAALEAAIVLPKFASLATLTARLGRVDMELAVPPGRSGITLVAGALNLITSKYEQGNLEAQIGSGRLFVYGFSGAMHVQAGYLDADLAPRAAFGKIAATSGRIRISSGKDTLYRTSRRIHTEPGNSKARQVGAHDELGPLTVPPLEIELTHGVIKAR